MTDRDLRHEALSKVPAVTLGFWIIKILATTLGETGGDTVTMTWLGETTTHPVPNGYLIGTAIFGLLLVGLVGIGTLDLHRQAKDLRKQQRHQEGGVAMADEQVLHGSSFEFRVSGFEQTLRATGF